MKRAVLNEGARKLWKAVLWIAVCGVLAALAAGIIIKGFEPQQNDEPSDEVRAEVSGETPAKVSEQGSSESSTQNIQATKKALKTTVSQSSGQTDEGNITHKDTAVTEDLKREPAADSSATDQPSSETSTENIDTESLEDLFKEAAGQIL